MTNFEWMRQRILHRVIHGAVGDKTEGAEDLRATEWSPEFERLMRNRLLMGRFRYGRLDRTTDTGYDRAGSAIKRLRHYQSTGNMEHLVDAANLCLVEFKHSTHPDKHFDAVDDGEHTERTK
jgi:hypothetical protein